MSVRVPYSFFSPLLYIPLIFCRCAFVQTILLYLQLPQPGIGKKQTNNQTNTAIHYMFALFFCTFRLCILFLLCCITIYNANAWLYRYSLDDNTQRSMNFSRSVEQMHCLQSFLLVFVCCLAWICFSMAIVLLFLPLLPIPCNSL